MESQKEKKRKREKKEKKGICPLDNFDDSPNMSIPSLSYIGLKKPSTN